MRRRLLFLLTVIACCLPSVVAEAHFLFLRIGPHAEGGRGAEVFFSESAIAGDPMFVGKIAHTKLWMQSEPGKFRPLSVRRHTDRLRAYLPAAKAAAVVGECRYGVLQRDVAFLLEYYPKAITGDPAKINALKPYDKAPLEVTATIKGGSITLMALQNGKPVPEAIFTTIDDDLVNEELKADKSGRAVFKPTESGHYSVYTKAVIKESGQHDGKKYSEIRRFATISFQWPLIRKGADEKAVEMFEKALSTRANWHNFPGFSAEVSGTVDGRQFDGTVKVDDDGTVDVKLDEATAVDWVEDQLGSIVMHRMAAPDRARPTLRFADNQEDHPLGRLLTFVGGDFASSYRVKDQQISVVNRHIGPMNMTITVLENQKTPEGNFLPRAYTVQYWNAADGSLLRTQTIQNHWRRVGKFDLPVENTVATSSSAGLTVRSLKLTNHKLSPNK